MLLLLLACAAADKESTPAPTLLWLAPSDGETVPVGETACSIILESFSLVDPAKHNTGAPIGYVRVSVDDESRLEVGTTTFSLDLEAGSHRLNAALFYADGDEVRVQEGSLCGEEDAECMPVEAAIDIVVE